VAVGIGRAGSIAAHGSGEIILAFSTANKIPRTTQKMIYHMKILLDQRLNPLYEAAIEATEEAILNSLCMARDLEGVNGNFAPALPLQEVKEIVERSALKPRPRPSPPVKPPLPTSPEAPRVSEAPPSAARGAEGMMTVPLPKPSGGEPGPASGAS
jgi:D-aminopeptidase